MISFLFVFGLMNVFTPVVLISTPDQTELIRFDHKQRVLLSNMFKAGVCLMFVSAGLYFMS